MDIIVILMHFGEELFSKALPYQLHITKHLMSLGVQVIIGAHPHVLQQHCVHDNKLVAYSLGNFLFHPRRPMSGVNPVIHDTKARWMITKTDPGRHLSGLVYYIINLPCYVNSDNITKRKHRDHRDPKQSVCVTDCLYFIVNVLDLPFASPTAIYINHCFPQANFFLVMKRKAGIF